MCQVVCVYLPADSLNLLSCRTRAKIGPARLRRVAPAERVPQEVERFLGQPADACLRFVDRQLQPRHHVPHRVQRLFGRAATADHEVIGIVDDASLQAAARAQRFPAQHESPHVQIRQQRRDRSALRAASSLVLVARRAMRVPAVVVFFDRRHQPQLDQMQHGFVADATSERTASTRRAESISK